MNLFQILFGKNQNQSFKKPILSNEFNGSQPLEEKKEFGLISVERKDINFEFSHNFEENKEVQRLNKIDQLNQIEDAKSKSEK